MRNESRKSNKEYRMMKLIRTGEGLRQIWGKKNKSLGISLVSAFMFIFSAGTFAQQKVENAICDTPNFKSNFRAFCNTVQYFDYEEAIECHKKTNKPLLIYFTGWYSANSMKMEKEVFCDSSVQERLSEFIWVSLYVDDKKVGEKNFKIEEEKFHFNAQPYFVILDTTGVHLTQSGYCRKESFLQFLDGRQ